MATAEQVKALLESHVDGDEQRFYTVAIQIAAQAARRGHGKLAEQIRELVDQAKLKAEQETKPALIAAPKGDLAGLLGVSYPDTRLSEMVLEESTRERLGRIIKEYLARQRILAHGLQPRRKVMLIGPPGSGKTMTARVLAGELRLPLLVLRLEGLITRFMGETAAKLRLVFESMATTRGVYLFDEFDAIGTQRGTAHDVGEIKRVLNSFLQLIEHDSSESVLVAATNYPEVLDHALFRRFDDIIEYGAPGAELIERALRNKLAVFATADVDWRRVVAAGQGLSYAELTRACEDAAKSALLEGHTSIQTQALLSSLEERAMTLRTDPTQGRNG
jgi:SpoVK/Ycf46/Vps4 family AAA+-type ATPase